VAGHVPRSITPAEASDSGLTSLEHMLQIPTPCTPAESLALAPPPHATAALKPSKPMFFVAGQ